jgi:hypothetical protein
MLFGLSKQFKVFAERSDRAIFLQVPNLRLQLQEHQACTKKLLNRILVLGNIIAKFVNRLCLYPFHTREPVNFIETASKQNFIAVIHETKQVSTYDLYLSTLKRVLSEDWMQSL